VVLLGYLALALLVYLFASKLRAYNVQPHEEEVVVPQKPSLEHLQLAVEQSPSFDNRVQLGWALFEQSQPAPARECFELALRSHPRDNEARYGLGLCMLEQGELEQAIDTLTELVERSFAHDDYRAAEALAEALHRSEQNDEAVSLLEAVVRSSRRIEHRIAHAKLLKRCAREQDATQVLERALSEFESQPEHIRRREGAHATEARRLLRTLSPSTD
jgi:tetratricopeptide (TPR) repeat protein